MCHYQQTSPESAFTKKRVCTILTGTGRVTLADSKLIISHGAERDEIPVSAAEWPHVLRDTFGIEAPLSSRA